ncbi:MAG: glycosyltransferase family A protein [Eubacteriales bacterium]|jgi:glycosyltransferase involved in cell wall biosynthesis|nr:glycosyltransferase family A protein [Eubacteriales bacterium]
MDLVSIVIPTYGGGENIINAVNSALSQDYKNIEVIVVDDNGQGTKSQLQTYERIRQFTSNENFRYVVHKQNKNGSAARNTGTREAKGKYIAFLDDDDTFKHDKISTQVAVLSSLDESYGMCYCSYVKKRNGVLEEVVKAKKSGMILYDILLHKAGASSGTLLIKKSAFEKVGGFDESFRRHQDWEFTARVASMYNIAASPKVGLEKNLTFRNSPRSRDEAIAYMNHYLKKMEPLIGQFSPRKQKKIIISNQLSICLRDLRTGNIKAFVKRFRELKAGTTGIWYILIETIKYIFKIIKRPSLRKDNVR